ncbi:hypothetical protein [Chroococcus sp. FPU101]|nr:hypothetical protein [Chroococcus sp. FPU101]
MSDFSFIKRTELTQYVSLSRSKIKSIIVLDNGSKVFTLPVTLVE